jgi:hypothetical protein
MYSKHLVFIYVDEIIESVLSSESEKEPRQRSHS